MELTRGDIMNGSWFTSEMVLYSCSRRMGDAFRSGSA
jgi:hypothetical protein